MRSIGIICLMVFLWTASLGQQKHWTSPDHLTLQYAGSIGYVSGGAGYNVFRGKARASFHYGHVPNGVGGPLNIVAGKLLFIPRQFSVSPRVLVNPFDAGLMISYHMGSNFSSTWPSHRYPENYYWWKTSIRFHLNAESSVTVRLRDHTIFKSLTGYIEINSNELYLVSLFQNLHSLKPSDVIKLGTGARLHF